VPSEPPLSLPFGGEESYRRAVREKYNAVEIWPQSDRWLTHVKEFIAATVAEWRPKLGLTPASRILNAGSGDESYNVSPGMVVDCDIADRKLVGLPHGVAGDITRLPLRSGAVDCCVCVGSVVNYVDVTRAIEEIARVVKPEGKVVLEFESSRSLEYVFTRHFGEDATRVSTFYIYENENIWVYGEDYMQRLLAQVGFEVVEVSRAHFVAPLIHGFVQNIHTAAKFTWLDRVLGWIPFLKPHSANVIYLCRRH